MSRHRILSVTGRTATIAAASILSAALVYIVGLAPWTTWNATPRASADTGSTLQGGSYYRVREQTVQLADARGSYLSVSLLLEMADLGLPATDRQSPTLSTEIERTVAGAMSARTAEQLMTPEWLEQVREDVRTQLNQVLPSGLRVSRVYFGNLVVS